jgi:hypothetical protein
MCSCFVFTGHASRPGEFIVSRSTRGLTVVKSDVMARPKLTLQPLVNSKPAGARAWSVWPRRYPVRRRSRSITASTRQSPVCGPLCHSHAASAIVRSQCARKSQLSTMRYVSLNSRISHTLSVPLVHRVPGPLAAVLHVPDLRETGTRNAEELWLY